MSLLLIDPKLKAQNEKESSSFLACPQQLCDEDTLDLFSIDILSIRKLRAFIPNEVFAIATLALPLFSDLLYRSLMHVNVSLGNRFFLCFARTGIGQV